jgi:2-C-methyl-D-erythritol 4-phosphate cytidylyltransferase
MYKHTHITAILLMAGKGERFSQTTPKQFIKLNNIPIFEIALKTLSECEWIDDIILVTPKNFKHPHYTCVEGGCTRQESSYNGLLACKENTGIVLIHDALRPFITQRIIKENIIAAHKTGAADTCIPSSDTLVLTKDSTYLHSIPKREELWIGQTPQSFKYPLILKAHKITKKTNVYDDCSLVLNLNHPVKIIRGEPYNFKITYPSDLMIANAIFNFLNTSHKKLNLQP